MVTREKKKNKNLSFTSGFEEKDSLLSWHPQIKAAVSLYLPTHLLSQTWIGDQFNVIPFKDQLIFLGLGYCTGNTYRKENAQSTSLVKTFSILMKQYSCPDPIYRSRK